MILVIRIVRDYRWFSLFGFWMRLDCSRRPVHPVPSRILPSPTQPEGCDEHDSHCKAHHNGQEPALASISIFLFLSYA